MPRIRLCILIALALVAVPLTAASPASADIGPPWCGTPIPDGTAALPDGSSPTDPVGSFPHIPWYAIGCTLDSIAARSDGRMSVQVTGQSANGFDLYAVTINALDTGAQQRDYAHWKNMRKWALTEPAKAQSFLAQHGANFKIPIFIQAGIHGNESEGIDADMRLIERLATTPYGTDPFVDDVLDHSIVIFNVIHNPDGHILNQRANGNNFDLNRDWLTQSQPETKATVPLIQKWLSPELLDQHGYVTPTLIEATTKPHNPGIEYDFWLKWNQARIDANEAAMNAIGLGVTRPINDWCPEAEPANPNGFCDDGVTLPGPADGRGLGRLGPVLHADVLPARRPERLDGRDVQQHRQRVWRPREHDARQGPHRLADCAGHGGRLDARVRHREPRGALARPARDLPPRRHRGCPPAVLPAAVRRGQQLDARVPRGLRHPGRHRPAERRRGEAPRRVALLQRHPGLGAQEERVLPGPDVRRGHLRRLHEPGAARPRRHGARDRRGRVQLDQPALRSSGRLEPRLPLGRRHRGRPERGDLQRDDSGDQRAQRRPRRGRREGQGLARGPLRPRAGLGDRRPHAQRAAE